MKNNLIENVAINDALGDRYLSYALSTITARSLPDVRDGLKPVHRRIMYSMKTSGNLHNRPYRKSASAVGYVMMHYHPHGDSAIYDSLVRMAQDFSMRYPLVDGQGNFGSIDGDNAAAFRYTEARLSKIAEALMEGIEEDAVEFQPNYNEQKMEPKVLPAAFPNLLANGSSGIAVGMASNIPSHNLTELCNALELLIKDRETSIPKLMKKIKGPDFPTGGVIVEDEKNIITAYTKGKGSIRVRARWEVEPLPGGMEQAVITEIPYQVTKSKLIEKIANLLNEKKLPLVGDIMDESADKIRIIITPKTRNISCEVMMESLFKLTDLESKFNLNMNVLDKDNVPSVMDIRQALLAFLDHRMDVLIRRTNYQLNKIKDRLEVLHGFEIVFLNLDEVIKIIRYDDDPKSSLIKRFKLSELQVEAILNMKLRALRKLEEMQIKNEIKELQEKKEHLNRLLENEDMRWSEISNQIAEIKKEFGDKRRTTLSEMPDVEIISLESVLPREAVTVICSKRGWIKCVKGKVDENSEHKYKDDDEKRFIIPAYNTDKLIIATKNGKFYTLSPDKLPSGRGYGEPISIHIDINGGDDIVDIIVRSGKSPEDRKWLLVSKSGHGFISDEENLIASTKHGKQVMNVKQGDELFKCIEVENSHTHTAIVGNNRKLLIFETKEIPTMQKGKGVILQKYRDGEVADIKTFNAKDGLQWQTPKQLRSVDDITMWLGKRAQTGKLPPIGFPRNNKFYTSE